MVVRNWYSISLLLSIFLVPEAKNMNTDITAESEFTVYKGVRIKCMKIMNTDDFRRNKSAQCLAKQYIDNGVELKAVPKNFKTQPTTHGKLSMLPGGGGNPADKLCLTLNINGKIERKEDEKGNEYSVCTLSDGSYISSWDLIHILR